MKVQVIRTTCAIEYHDIPNDSDLFAQLARLAGCTVFDQINLRDGRVMLLDDDGYETELIDHGVQDGPLGKAATFENKCIKAKKPVNAIATKLYHAVCVPGTTHQIVGDVIIVSDSDME